jgi:hypothetical protein
VDGRENHSDQLIELILQLAIDPDAYASYLADEDAFLRKRAASKNTIEALKAKNFHQLMIGRSIRGVMAVPNFSIELH